MAVQPLCSLWVPAAVVEVQNSSITPTSWMQLHFSVMRTFHYLEATRLCVRRDDSTFMACKRELRRLQEQVQTLFDCFRASKLTLSFRRVCERHVTISRRWNTSTKQEPSSIPGESPLSVRCTASALSTDHPGDGQSLPIAKDENTPRFRDLPGDPRRYSTPLMK